jgi:hypothetical protein
MQRIVTYVRSYLKSVLRYIFLILDTYHLDNLYLREQGCENSRLFFKSQKGPASKTFGKHCCLVLTDWSFECNHIVFPVRYELNFYHINSIHVWAGIAQSV